MGLGIDYDCCLFWDRVSHGEVPLMSDSIANSHGRGRNLSALFSVELGFSFPTRIGKNLTWWRNATLNQDTDCAILIDGKEGSAKSHAAQQLGYFMDIDAYEPTGDIDPTTKNPINRPTERAFGLDQMCFTYEQFKKAVRELPPFKAIVFDEAGRDTDRRGSTNRSNINFNQMLRECRQYNKFLILVVQSFYDMDMVPAIWRTRCLLHFDYEWDLDKPLTPLVRGRCRFYNEKGKKDLYSNKLSRLGYKYPFLKNRSFDVMFGYHWVIDHEEYKKKKELAEKSRDNVKIAVGAFMCPSCGGSLRFRIKTKEHVCKKCGNIIPTDKSISGARKLIKKPEVEY